VEDAVRAGENGTFPSRKLRLLFVIDSFNSGGAQRQMILLAVALAQRGHHVEFFRYAPGDLLAAPLAAAGIKVTTEIKASRHSIRPVLALRRLIARGRFDCVLSFLETPNIYALAAAKTRWRPVPVVVSDRSYDPPIVPLKKNLLRQAYRLAKAVVVNSRHQGENFLRRYPWLRGRLSTILNGVDAATFHHERIDLPPEPLRLLAVASVSPFKNGLCLVEALRLLRDNHGITPKVTWIGQHVETITERREYAIRMNEAIVRYGLESQWEWLHQRSDVPQLMSTHHALVHPSFVEGLPNVVCEALSCGLPVLISNVLDHPHLVQDGRSGFLFDPHNPQTLAEAILKFHHLDKDGRSAMAENATAFARANLSVNRLANEYERLFLQVTGRAA
jgi:glycosyltransferase involved in cell wall biosynthesis